MLENVTVETFAPHVGETFQLWISETQKVPVTLIAVERHGPAFASGPTRAPFGLLFRPPRGSVPPQRTYRMEHDRIGTLEIFLVPVTPDAEGPRLEAIFS